MVLIANFMKKIELFLNQSTETWPNEVKLKSGVRVVFGFLFLKKIVQTYRRYRGDLECKYSLFPLCSKSSTICEKGS